MAFKTKNLDTLIRLIRNSDQAETVVNDYCMWQNKRIPFSFQKNGVIYARSTDIYDLFPNYRTFANARAQNKELFISLGSLCISDTSMRSEFIRDHRQLTSWLHNPSGLALGLASRQPLFNSYVGMKYNIQLSSTYSLSFLQDFFEVKHKQLELPLTGLKLVA